MRTRAKTAASHCIVTRVPVEIVTSILKYGCIDHQDLRSIAGTCRYLRAIASPLLFKEMSFVLERVASLDVLQGMRTQPDKANLVESLSIRANSNLTPLQAGRYLPIVSSVLPHLTNLTALSIPFSLLSEAVFTFVYDHPTIVSLGLVHVTRKCAAHSISLESTAVRPPRSKPLSIPVVYLNDEDNHAFSKSFIKFLDRHNIEFPHLEFLGPSMPTFLIEDSLPGLDRVFILISVDDVQKAYDFVRLVAVAQPSLGWTDFEFRPNFSADTFELGDVWPVWLPGAGLVPIQSLVWPHPFVKAWAGINLSELRVSTVSLLSKFGYDGFDDDFDDDERGVICVTFEFARRAVLTPSAIQHLARELPWVSAVYFHGYIGWENWESTIRILDGCHTFTPYGMGFDCSLTPTPTVSTTLACSSTCYTKLAKTHPALVVDAQLVGGYLAVWDLTYSLNLARVKRVAPAVQESSGEVQWTITGTKQVVDVKGSFDHPGFGDMEWGRDSYAHVLTVDKVKDCFCFGCGKVDGDDPVTAFKKCPVDEVRDALRAIGFDLDSFNERAPSQPIDPTSLETFLRSSSA